MVALISPYQKQTSKNKNYPLPWQPTFPAAKRLQLHLENKQTMTKVTYCPIVGRRRLEIFKVLRLWFSVPVPSLQNCVVGSNRNILEKYSQNYPAKDYSLLWSIGISLWVKQWKAFPKLQKILLCDQDDSFVNITIIFKHVHFDLPWCFFSKSKTYFGNHWWPVWSYLGFPGSSVVKFACLGGSPSKVLGWKNLLEKG